jgi:hypothetical protein
LKSFIVSAILNPAKAEADVRSARELNSGNDPAIRSIGRSKGFFGQKVIFVRHLIRDILRTNKMLI